MPTYKESGVDIEKADKIVDSIKMLWPGIGMFGGKFEIGPHIKGMNNPILISSIDGVGTKTKIATHLNDYTAVGCDIVNHCVNDIIVHGAKPLFFMDYIASSNLNPDMVSMVLLNMATACRENGLQVVGGETAEMPGVYEKGEFDIVGSVVGVVDKKDLIDGSTIEEGDLLIGLASTGLHTNGFSLVNKILKDLREEKISNANPMKPLDPHVLYFPHKSYYKDISLLVHKDIDIKGIAHITGGGIADNLARIIPEDLTAVVEKGSWPVLPIFQAIQDHGVSEEEMFNVFNMGLGMILVVNKRHVNMVFENIENSFLIGSIERNEQKREKVVFHKE